MKILASDKHVRAVQGGLGEAKTAANYAASLSGQAEAEAQGYSSASRSSRLPATSRR